MTRKHIANLLTLITLSVFLVMPPVSAAPRAGTYTVNSNTDAADANPGDGICAVPVSGNCTLRAAIQEANLDGVPSTINFAFQLRGVNAITSNLPTITGDYTTIDASNWWDMMYDRPGVEVGAGSGDIMTIQASNTQVLGLLFFGSDNGIHITAGSNNTVGGSASGQRNVFLTQKYGVWIQSSGTYNAVTHNYFGTVNGATGSAVPFSGAGVYVFGGQTLSTITDNLIGRYAVGVLLGADANVVANNIIGLDSSKAYTLSNGIGVKILGDYNVVGGGNVIAGNTSHGIELYHANGNYFYGNYIGYYTSSVDCGNEGDGIHIHASANNYSEGNTIIYNNGYGVYADGSAGITVQGGAIAANGLDGVYFQSCIGGQIGGSSGSQRNEITDNAGNGVRLDATSGVTITGNYIGLSLGAYEGSNLGYGILIDNGSTNNVVGGTTAGAGNWIGYNHKSGIELNGSSTQGNYVLGNVIGAPINWGWQAPNAWHGIGIYGGAHNNLIGAMGTGNTIVASGWSGVAIVSGGYNGVVSNTIGTDGAGHNWGNAFYGIDIGSAGNIIAINEIAYNGSSAEAGVRVNGTGAIHNILEGNSIHDNSGKGIQLVSGGNITLTAPTITQAGCAGPVAGNACAGCLVQIFSDNADEGRVYEGCEVANGTTGAFSWSGTPNGPYVTATATDGSGNTSEFSAPFSVSACNTSPTATFTVTPLSGTISTVFNFDASGSSDAEDPTSALQVRWDWESDGTYDTSWGITKTATHSFSTTGTRTVRLQAKDTGGLTSVATRSITVTSGSLWTLQGQVFGGNVGDHSHPLPGVVVAAYSAGAPYPVSGTLIVSATTDADGWYSLTVPEGYAYYSIREEDWPVYLSRGATSVGGVVREASWIEFTAPLSGTTLTGNKFWDYAAVLSGRVYEGDVGDESTPLSGVTVELRCADSPTGTGGPLDSTTTKADGWYGLTVPILCDYYNIVELDPPDFVSVNAMTVSGTVKTANWIQYTHPLTGQTTTGNRFWDRAYHFIYLPLVLKN